MTTKVCTVCHTEKPESEFYARKTRCKKCYIVIQKEINGRKAKKTRTKYKSRPRPILDIANGPWV